MNQNQNQEQALDFKKYLNLTISYLWLIILLPTILGVSTYFYSIQQPKIYEVHATLLVEQRSSGLSAGVSDYQISSHLAKTYGKLIMADPFLDRVKEKMGLADLVELVQKFKKNRLC